MWRTVAVRFCDQTRLVSENSRMSENYPTLFCEMVWPDGPTSVQFVSDEPPLEDLISNINAVPVTADGRWVVIKSENGTYEIPGGTVEAGEEPLCALERELMEEAGAVLRSKEYIGAWRMQSHAEKPFRSHLPHPVAYRVVYRCEVALVRAPQIPEEEGEMVVDVMALSLDDAAKCFEAMERFELAELYRFAATFNGRL